MTLRRLRHAALIVLAASGLASCAPAAPPRDAPPPVDAAPPADLEIRVGSGGGAAGAWRVVRLRPDGRLIVEWSTAGRHDAEADAGLLDEARRREAWTLVREADLAALGCEPGNMTDELEVTASGVTTRACAPMDQGSPEFRRIFGEMERLIALPAAGVNRPPPPLPELPARLCLEVVRGRERFRIARDAASLPADVVEGARVLGETDLLEAWRALFAAGFYGGASIERRDGVAVPGAPFACGEDVAVRVTVGTAETWETRQRCVEGDAGMQLFAAKIEALATR